MNDESALKKIEQIFKRQKQNFGKGDLYQSYEPLKWSGQRKTELRFKSYALEKFLSKEYDVLDAGCNCGFFTNYVSSYVKSIDGFDKNKSLIEMANTLARHLEKTNTTFQESDFASFNPTKKYDFVIVSAMHQWVGLDTEDFCAKIFQWVKASAYILIESHQIDKDDQYEKILGYLEKSGCKKEHEGSIIEKIPNRRNRKIKRLFSLWSR